MHVRALLLPGFTFEKNVTEASRAVGKVQIFCKKILLDIIDRQKENSICGFILKEKGSRISHGGKGSRRKSASRDLWTIP